MERIVTERSSPGIGPYSQAIRANGFVFVSGQLGLSPNTSSLVEGGVEPELIQAMANVAEILAEAGSSWAKVVKATVFLADMNDFGLVNKLYSTKVGDIPPARTAVQVAALPRNARIEIDVIAVV